MPSFTLFPCSIKVGRKLTDFLHRNQNFGVIIGKSDYDTKNLIMMQKTPLVGHVDRVIVKL